MAWKAATVSNASEANRPSDRDALSADDYWSDAGPDGLARPTPGDSIPDTVEAETSRVHTVAFETSQVGTDKVGTRSRDIDGVKTASMDAAAVELGPGEGAAGPASTHDRAVAAARSPAADAMSERAALEDEDEARSQLARALDAGVLRPASTLGDGQGNEAAWDQIRGDTAGDPPPQATDRGRASAKKPRRATPRGGSGEGAALFDPSCGTAEGGMAVERLDADGEPMAGGAIDADRAEHEEKAREVAVRRLSLRPHSRAELRTAMVDKGVPAQIADSLLAHYEELKLIDDEQFAQQWVESRHRSRKISRRVLSDELRRKGVDDATAAQALDQIDTEDEVAAARAIGAKKLRAMARLEPQVAQRRLYAALARRGYGPGVCREVVRELLAEPDEGFGES